MITVTLYTRQGCHLCEEAKADLAALQAEVPHRLAEIDLDTHSDLKRKFGDKIPVVEAGPYRKFAPFNRTDLLVTLRAARDRQESLERIGSPDYIDRVRRGQTVDKGDKVSLWVSKNYIWLINLMILLYVGLPFMAPVFMKAGLQAPARAVYFVYSPFCHQLAFRSWFLFGEQDHYPREAAGLQGIKTYEEVTGLPSEDLLSARNFIGDEHAGYKVALCERDVAIYGAILLFGVVFALTGRRFKPLPWWLWLLLGIFPVGLDGFSQLFSQLNLPWLAQIFPFRESTPLLRTITGFLFGLTTAWFGLPYVEETMRESQQVLVKKMAVSEARSHDKDG